MIELWNGDHGYDMINQILVSNRIVKVADAKSKKKKIFNYWEPDKSDYWEVR